MLGRCLSFVMLLVLVACTQAPQPYRHGRTGVDTSGLRLRDGGTVLIMPIEGAARPMAEIIGKGLADSLGTRNIPSTSNPLNNPSYKVRGQVILNFSSKKDDYLGQIYWTFADRNGTVVHESSQQISATAFQWNYGDQEMIDTLVETAAEEFAGYLQDRSESQAVEVADHDKDIVFKITQVKGARGDGERSLKKAMALTLRQYGARVRTKADEDTYLLSAEVDIFEPYENQERIKINWIVQDANGKELGRAGQDNRLPEGQLDGKWGRLAYEISKAAVPGIGEIVERHRIDRKFEASRPIPNTTAAPGRRNRAAPPPF